jgi:RHS repeat-associated protein
MTYLYDANVNMTSDGTKCLEYNDANQLRKVKKCSDNKIIAEYIYDHTGKRIIKKEYENATLKRTVYSPSDEYETVVLASNGAKLNTTYYKVNDEVVAKKNPDGTLNYYHNDHLGSNSVLTNQSGAVVEKTTYEPYGEVKSGGTKSKFGYTGQEKDQETGLNYYDSRYYDPHLQRFVQPDTMLPDVYDPQQLNRYSYARNNPVKYTDPSGHVTELVIIGVILGLYAAFAMPAILPNNSNNQTGAIAAIGSIWNWLNSYSFNKITSKTESTTKASASTNTTTNQQQNNKNQSGGGSSGGGSSSGGSKDGGSIKPQKIDPKNWIKDNFKNPEKGPEGWKEYKYGDKPSDRNFHNPKTDESLGPDLEHGPNKDPHWDYRDTDKQWWRIYEDGRMEMK